MKLIWYLFVIALIIYFIVFISIAFVFLFCIDKIIKTDYRLRFHNFLDRYIEPYKKICILFKKNKSYQNGNKNQNNNIGNLEIYNSDKKLNEKNTTKITDTTENYCFLEETENNSVSKTKETSIPLKKEDIKNLSNNEMPLENYDIKFNREQKREVVKVIKGTIHIDYDKIITPGVWFLMWYDENAPNKEIDIFYDTEKNGNVQFKYSPYFKLETGYVIDTGDDYLAFFQNSKYTKTYYERKKHTEDQERKKIEKQELEKRMLELKKLESKRNVKKKNETDYSYEEDKQKIIDDNYIESEDIAYSEPDYLNNHYINSWWSKEHDKLLKKAIQEKHWIWSDNIYNEIVAITSVDIIEKWQNNDPILKHKAWYNYLIGYAEDRAEYLGLKKLIRKSKRKTCYMCKTSFYESSVPTLVLRNIDLNTKEIPVFFCRSCIEKSLFRGENKEFPIENIPLFICNLYLILKKIPNQTEADGKGYITYFNLPKERQKKLLSLLSNRPSIDIVKDIYGSWFSALVESGILSENSQKTSRGVRTISKDGTVCLSLGELKIADFLYSKGIKYVKEPSYPEGNYRADFEVNGIFIEYFGLTGLPEYDMKTSIKIAIANRHDIKLISIYPKDLLNEKILEKKLQILLQNIS